MVVAAALIVGLKETAGDDLAYAAIAGAGLVLGLGALYQAMAVGSMAIAAPIAATGVIIPWRSGWLHGDNLEPSRPSAYLQPSWASCSALARRRTSTNETGDWQPE